MDWQGLLRRIHSDHPHEPQLLGRCELAIAQAREALQMLAGHGYRFHLVDGAGEPYPEWPKKLYHVDAAPNGHLVFCEQDAVALGPGWFDSFAKAQYWDGLETQFHGRGGVPKSPRPPAIIFQNQIIDHDDTEARKALIAAFKALHRWEQPTILEEPSDAKQIPSTAPTDGSGGTQSEIRPEGGNSAKGWEGVLKGGSDICKIVPPSLEGEFKFQETEIQSVKTGQSTSKGFLTNG